MSDAEQAAWRSILQSQHLQNPFMTCQFSRLVEKSGMSVWVAIIYNGYNIIAFFPFQYSSLASRLVGRAERVGGEMSDYCGVIAQYGVRFDERELLRLAGIQIFEFSHLHSSQLAMGLTASKSDVGHLIRRGAADSGYWHELSQRDRRLAQDTLRCIGKFDREIGPLSFEPDVLGQPDLLDTLIRMKRAQYRRTNVPDALHDAWRRRFLQLLYAEQAPECRGILSVLSCRSGVVALHFGLITGQTLHYWFPVYDVEYAQYSPGRLVYKHLIDSMASMGLEVIDHGAGNAAYKIALSNGSYTLYSGCWTRRTPQAFVSLATKAVERRVKSLLHRM